MLAMAATRQSGGAAHNIRRGDTSRLGRAQPLPSLKTLQKEYHKGTSDKSGVILEKELIEYLQQLREQSEGEPLFVALAFDATDLTAEARRSALAAPQPRCTPSPG